MNNEFPHIGKRMPYSTPQNLFSEIEANVMQQIGSTQATDGAPTVATNAPRKSATLRRVFNVVLATAASVAIIACAYKIFTPSTSCNIEDIDNAFCNLSDADQEFLISVDQQDIFLNGYSQL